VEESLIRKTLLKQEANKEEFKMGLGDRLAHAWNAFTGRDNMDYGKLGPVYSSLNPNRPHFSRGGERSIVNSVYNRIALDVCAVHIQHVKLDDQGRFLEEVDSGLNNCLTVEANIDQTGRAFIQDAVMSLLDEGVVALVPIETNISPDKTEGYKIETMRTGKIIAWYPEYVKVSVYNERSGNREEIVVPKKTVAIIENPFYSVMNEPNSTMQRLIRKLSLLDNVDEQSSSGKLDLIIQLPYTIKTEARKVQAEQRRKEIETQLTGSKYGIAYTDGTEHITQLNRSLENNLMTQIEYLTNQLYAQLGLTTEIMNGTADELAMLNYKTRVIEPIVAAIADEMKRKFLSKTARSQNHSIEFFIDPFSLVPVNNIAEIADKFTRNEIMTSNEIRQIIGLKPSAEPNADELRNKNMPIEGTSSVTGVPQDTAEQDKIFEDFINGITNDINSIIDQNMLDSEDGK